MNFGNKQPASKLGRSIVTSVATAQTAGATNLFRLANKKRQALSHSHWRHLVHHRLDRGDHGQQLGRTHAAEC
jgi:hypothetical protein